MARWRRNFDRGIYTMYFHRRIQAYIQLTLIIAKLKGPSETLRDIRTLTYQIFRIHNILWDRDNSSTRQLIDTVFGDNSSTQLKTTHRLFLKTIHRHICLNIICNHR